MLNPLSLMGLQNEKWERAPTPHHYPWDNVLQIQVPRGACTCLCEERDDRRMASKGWIVVWLGVGI